jgi:hypothetical protein
VVDAIKAEFTTDTWLIFPTERSCREALTAFQAQWQPLNINFLSMDEFKQRVIYSDAILLQDEKRLVCLYQAMTPEDRAVFHIEKYPDLIDWGQHFFELFEDLAEECVAADALYQRMQNLEFSYQEWQLQNFERMLAIRSRYQTFIAAKGYADDIFDRHISNLRLPADVRRFVFVNQFYYSQLEQAIITRIEERRLKAVIYWQGKADWWNESKLRSGDLVLAEAFPEEVLPFTIKVFESTNLWQMALSFLNNFSPQLPEPKDRHFIIDAGFLQQAYHQVFSKQYFHYAEQEPVHKTRLFHFLQTVGKGLENLLYVNGKLMVRLDWLLQAIGMNGFISYFRPGWESSQADSFTGFVCKFSENDILYLDVELNVLDLTNYKECTEENRLLLTDIMELLKHLAKIGTAGSLANSIDDKHGIRINELLSADEKTCSTLQECFYEGLASFTAMDELALVDDWQMLYPGMPLSAGIFDLFLSFLKPRKYRLNRKEEYQPVVTITNLLDTRNLQAEKVTFLNLTENVLPSGRTPVWLFNEKQRKVIGLKTWDDIRNWERHYFYRLIASAKQIEFYTIANQDKDIEPSSFLCELYQFSQIKQDKGKAVWQKCALPADTLFRNRFHDNADSPLAAHRNLSDLNPSAFFSLPCNIEKDFGGKQMISMSWSVCNHFLHNPFLYFLQDNQKLRSRILNVEETLGRKMFGKLLHLYLMVITQRLAEQHNGVLSMKWEWINNDFLTRNLEHTLAKPLLAYQLPANYNRHYLSELMSPFLIDTAAWFFHVGLAREQDFAESITVLIPESEDSTLAEQQYKVLLSPEDTGLGIGISIRGRADLRLETQQKRFIIDFKTGGYDELQLLFYKWFYYLIEQPELEDKVRTAVYRLLDKDMDWLELKRAYSKDKLKPALLDSMKGITLQGYEPDCKGTNQWDAVDITRVDLLGNITYDEEQE